MAAMHPWGHHDCLDQILNPERDIDIAVVELRCPSEETIKNDQTPKRWAPNDYHGAFHSAGDNELADVKPQCRGYVNLHVSVMGPVKTPEKTDLVVGQMHPVVPKVEGNYSSYDLREATEPEECGEA